MLVKLLVEPPFELVHQRLAMRLVVRQARLRAQLFLTRLFVVVKYLPDDLEHHLTFVRKHRFEIADLAPTMGQAMTADERRFISNLIARKRVGHHQRSS